MEEIMEVTSIIVNDIHCVCFFSMQILPLEVGSTKKSIDSEFLKYIIIIMLYIFLLQMLIKTYS